MRRLVISLALLVLLCLGAILARSFRKASAPGPLPAPTPPAYATAPAFVAGPIQRLHSPDTDALVDVSALRATLSGLSQSLQGNLPPIGDDRDLARALLGRNRDGLAYRPPIRPPTSPPPATSATAGAPPYLVHPRAPGDFEIRSAGPDQKFFTPDDLVLSSGHYIPHAGASLATSP